MPSESGTPPVTVRLAAREALHKARATMDCGESNEWIANGCAGGETNPHPEMAKAPCHYTAASALLDGLSVSAVTKAGG